MLKSRAPFFNMKFKLSKVFTSFRQVLSWTLAPVRAAWASPALSAALASPAAFFGHYIGLQPDPAGGVLVSSPMAAAVSASVTQRQACSLKGSALLHPMAAPCFVAHTRCMWLSNPSGIAKLLCRHALLRFEYTRN